VHPMRTTDYLAALAAPLLFVLACFVANHRSLFFRRLRCRRCGPAVPMRRVSRGVVDRLIGKIIACKRYECVPCRWSGLIRNKVVMAAGGSRPVAGSFGSSQYDIPTINDAATFPKPLAE